MGDFLVFERFVWFDRQVRQKRFPNARKLAELVKSGAEYAEPKLSLRDAYIFEFLGLKPKEVMGESALEDRLLDKLQEFLLELGHGFCFEARQKPILIGDTHNFVDLVFYHRILKCHVLVLGVSIHAPRAGAWIETLEEQKMDIS